MNEPAFPATYETAANGLTKREYAATHIAAAMASRTVAYADEDFASRAVALADAVLAEAAK